MPGYRVVWEIDVEAETVIEALKNLDGGIDHQSNEVNLSLS